MKMVPMQMLVDFEQLFSKFKIALDSVTYEDLLELDREIKDLFIEYVNSEGYNSTEELASIVEQHNNLVDLISTSKKSKHKQLAKYHKNQKNLKKYQNV